MWAKCKQWLIIVSWLCYFKKDEIKPWFILARSRAERWRIGKLVVYYFGEVTCSRMANRETNFILAVMELAWFFGVVFITTVVVGTVVGGWTQEKWNLFASVSTCVVLIAGLVKTVSSESDSGSTGHAGVAASQSVSVYREKKCRNKLLILVLITKKIFKLKILPH